MKKQLLTAILALASLAATAATGSGTFYLGGQSKWDGLTYENADGGSSMIFVSNYNTYSASQTILSDLDLVDLVPTTAADGTTTKAKITGLKFKVTIADWYGMAAREASPLPYMQTITTGLHSPKTVRPNNGQHTPQSILQQQV